MAKGIRRWLLLLLSRIERLLRLIETVHINLRLALGLRKGLLWIKLRAAVLSKATLALLLIERLLRKSIEAGSMYSRLHLLILLRLTKGVATTESSDLLLLYPRLAEEVGLLSLKLLLLVWHLLNARGLLLGHGGHCGLILLY